MLNLKIADDLTHGEVANALWDQRENLLAYAISFAVIARFWVVHHSFFGEVKAFDARLIGLNMFYLGWVVLIPFSSEVLGEYAGSTAAVVLYATNLAGVVLIAQWMTWDARTAGLTSIDDATQRENLFRALFIAAVFLFSVAVAFVAPRRPLRLAAPLRRGAQPRHRAPQQASAGPLVAWRHDARHEAQSPSRSPRPASPSAPRPPPPPRRRR